MEDIKNLIIEVGGTNSLICRGQYKDIDVIVKQLGFEPIYNINLPRLSKDVFKKILLDFHELRYCLIEAQINIPTLYLEFYVPDNNPFNVLTSERSKTSRLILVEAYCGQSLTKIIRKNLLSKNEIDSLIQNTYKIISDLPEDIELDINPSNFTCIDNEIYFVDFMPPKIKEYQQNSDLTSIFPQIQLREEAREYRRTRRYNSLDGRLERFNFYLQKLTSIPQNQPI